VYVEIVRIAYWIGGKDDGSVFYQVNLVSPSLLGFDRDQRGTLSLDYNLGCGLSEFEAVTALLADAKRFIEWHKEHSEKMLTIVVLAPEEQRDDKEADDAQ
jgi:hypothetical protein